MSEASTQVTLKLPNGVSLIYPSGLESLEISTLYNQLGYVIGHPKKGSIKIDLVPYIGGGTLLDSKDSGLSQA